MRPKRPSAVLRTIANPEVEWKKRPAGEPVANPPAEENSGGARLENEPCGRKNELA